MNAMHPEERREFPRYKIKDDVYLTFRPDFDRVGKIRDISAGGAAFEYVQYTTLASISEVEVDIFSQSKEFHWPKIPCKVVYDRRVEKYPSFEGIETRRCGLKFTNLSKRQLTQLNFFLANFPQDAALKFS